MLTGDTIVRHHVLEIILWPNEDGTFREIRNSMARLKELGIYDDYKMTIEITNREHAQLHHTLIPGWNRGLKHTPEAKLKMSISRKGKPKSDEHKRKIGLANSGIKNYKFNKPQSDFGKKYFEYYGYSASINRDQYERERSYYRRHNKCSWE